MFTGLIECVGEVTQVLPVEGGFRIRVAADLGPDLREGESVSINGVCLTAVEVGPNALQADIGPETARVTTLGALKSGAAVNLERALRADGRLGGHFVLGHIDGTGTIAALRSEADFWWLSVNYPEGLAPYLVHRGSIAVDGISLTLAGVDRTRFDAQIVPFTWAHTNLKGAAVGDRVNIECDMVGKYVARAVELMSTTAGEPIR